MEITRVQMVKQNVTTAVRCDSCGREAHPDIAARGWHRFSASSGYPDGDDWFDVCSPPCFAQCVREQVRQMESWGSERAEVAEMPLPFAQALADALAAPDLMQA